MLLVRVLTWWLRSTTISVRSQHIGNFPNTCHLDLDLASAKGSEILAAINMRRGEIDVVTGGPPCQGFSHMGRRELSDDRNLLLLDFFRLVTELRPRAFVLENVPGLLQGHYADWLEQASKQVSEDYWLAGPRQISAFEAGAPTMRKRVFLIGVLKSITTSSPATLWQKDPNRIAPTVHQALDGLPLDVSPDWKKSRAGTRKVKVTRSGFFFSSASSRIPKGVGDAAALTRYTEEGKVSGCLGTNHSAALIERYAALAFGKSDSKTKSVRLDPKGYCPTLRAGTGPDKGSFQAVRPIHHIRPRVITPREAARLQGFPDWFQFDRTKWHSFRQIGNSVSPLVSEYVLSRVRKLIDADISKTEQF